MYTLSMRMCRCHEQLLVDHVAREGDYRDTEAWESAPEAVGAGEGAGVAPCLTTRNN